MLQADSSSSIAPIRAMVSTPGERKPDGRFLLWGWRREWDSNPRYAVNVHTLSKRAP